MCVCVCMCACVCVCLCVCLFTRKNEIKTSAEKTAKASHRRNTHLPTSSVQNAFCFGISNKSCLVKVLVCRLVARWKVVDIVSDSNGEGGTKEGVQ